MIAKIKYLSISSFSFDWCFISLYHGLIINKSELMISKPLNMFVTNDLFRYILNSRYFNNIFNKVIDQMC